jgi:UDPglucose 6-dehydrogenase
MKIGVIGLGMVGEAVSYGISRVGHTVIGYDIKYQKPSFADVCDTQLIFVCVPTPTRWRRIDASAVWTTAEALATAEYKGLVVIKSTVLPGTTDKIKKAHPQLQLAFCPEFLRERARFSDFYEDHEVCVIGSYDNAHVGMIKHAHGTIPKSFAVLTPTEAELAKYFVNTFNAMRIVFANEFYDVCKASDADYTKILQTVGRRKTSPAHYLECNENFRAFGGSCLPKDTAAFAEYAESLGIKTEIFRAIVDINQRLREPLPTVVGLK